jgi:hypothetical protein
MRNVLRDTHVVADPIPIPAIVKYRGEFMPPRFVNKMRYSEVWGITTSGGIQTYTYHMNSVYDPYVGAGGNGCYGITEMAAIYDRYRVLGTEVVISATNKATEPVSLYVWPTCDSTTPTEVRAESAPGSRNTMLAQYFNHVFSFYEPTSKWLMNSRDYDASAATNANPAKLYYLQIYMGNGDATALNLIMRVTLIMDVEWSVIKGVD